MFAAPAVQCELVAAACAAAVHAAMVAMDACHGTGPFGSPADARVETLQAKQGTRNAPPMALPLLRAVASSHQSCSMLLLPAVLVRDLVLAQHAVPAVLSTRHTVSQPAGLFECYALAEKALSALLIGPHTWGLHAVLY